MAEKKSKTNGKTSEKPVGKTAKSVKNSGGLTAGKTPGKAAPKPDGRSSAKTVSEPAARAGLQTQKINKNAGKTTVPKNLPPVPFTQEFIKKMEQMLLELKAEIMDNLISNNNDLKEIVEGMDPKDFVDIASDDMDRKMIETLGYQELKRLKLLESALTRIWQGKYGYCIKCDKQIPPDRLEAIPYALMCIGCKSEEERRSR